MKPKTDEWKLQHILEAIGMIECCVQRKKENDSLVEAALERFIINIGEMCRSLSPRLKEKYPAIPWQDIVSMRNILVHEYYKTDKETIWDTAEHKIPALKDWIVGIIEKEGVENG
jgi:uncharacterized protein with HEPN domain